MAQSTEMRNYPVVNAMIGLFADWLRHRREIAEACNCAPGEYDQIARELGVTTGELDDLVRRGTHAADELPRLMAALNLDVAAIARTQPLVLRDMERVCAHCENKRRCRTDLADGAAAFEHADYCGNAPTLGALARE